MQVKKNVHSGSLTFKQLEVNVDTVFYRFNERKWYEKDKETGKDIHIGWIYDEIWYDKDAYIEKISEENEMLELAVMEMALANEGKIEETELAIAELTNLIGEVL